jgi:D-beta-D-heptose 7-phosphate kinase/D-beta-D-heptose 1-phosphate adenosyltransferase
MRKVFVNGTFDVLHPGHIALLRYAVDSGQHLLVAIDSDRRVRELKGDGRPFFDAADRKFILESINGVDEVVVFDTDQDLEDIIREYAPDVMVKGSDYKNRHIIGAEHCAHIEFFKRIDEYSTSKILQHSSNR